MTEFLAPHPSYGRLTSFWAMLTKRNLRIDGQLLFLRLITLLFNSL